MKAAYRPEKTANYGLPSLCSYPGKLVHLLAVQFFFGYAGEYPPSDAWAGEFG